MLPRGWRDDDEVARPASVSSIDVRFPTPFFPTSTNGYKISGCLGIDMTVVIDTVELAATGLSNSGVGSRQIAEKIRFQRKT
jgi:hypothetical protein